MKSTPAPRPSVYRSTAQAARWPHACRSPWPFPLADRCSKARVERDSDFCADGAIAISTSSLSSSAAAAPLSASTVTSFDRKWCEEEAAAGSVCSRVISRPHFTLFLPSFCHAAGLRGVDWSYMTAPHFLLSGRKKDNSGGKRNRLFGRKPCCPRLRVGGAAVVATNWRKRHRKAIPAENRARADHTVVCFSESEHLGRLRHHSVRVIATLTSLPFPPRPTCCKSRCTAKVFRRACSYFLWCALCVRDGDIVVTRGRRGATSQEYFLASDFVIQCPPARASLASASDSPPLPEREMIPSIRSPAGRGPGRDRPGKAGLLHKRDAAKETAVSVNHQVWGFSR